MPQHPTDGGERTRAEARRQARIAARTLREQTLAAGATAPTSADVSRDASQESVTANSLGFRAAFRSSIAAAPIRSDLRALPALLRTRAFVIPLLVSGITIVISVQQGALTSGVVQLAVQSILLPPAFVLAFLSGMLTRRGSWMMGGLFGLISYAGSVFVAHVGDLRALEPTNPIRALLEGAGGLGAGAALLGNLYFVAIAGVLAGSFAGWYGRFLRAMAPAPASSRDRRRREAERRKGRGR